MSDANCPECGRRKARNVKDAAEGCCPKWWAITDPAADADCIRHRPAPVVATQMTDASKSVREFLEKYPGEIVATCDNDGEAFIVERGDIPRRNGQVVLDDDITPVLNALPALLAELDEAKANVSALELDLKNSFARNVAHIEIALKKDIALTTLTRQRDGLVEAVEEVASKSTCECWDVPAMGSGLPYRWKGCKVHHSTDPEEWCLCCVAHAALVAARKEQG